MNSLHLSYMNLPGNRVSDLRGQRQVSKSALISLRSLTQSTIMSTERFENSKKPAFPGRIIIIDEVLD